MSTTTQRPTPETDAAIKKTWPADAISLAVKLERERDEAREEIESILNVIPADAPCLHAETGETVADYILDLQKEVGRVHALYFNDRQQHCNPMKPLLLLCLLLTSCQTVKDRFDLWFVVPKNPFNQPIQKP